MDLEQLRDVLNELRVDFADVKNELKHFVTMFDKISDDQGFPRCVEREQRLIRLEHDAIEAKKDIRDMKKEINKVSAIEKALQTITIKREAFDVWLLRLTWGVIILGLLKWMFFGKQV